jgi:hypothetical protein
METPVHVLQDLFAQLGLPDSAAEIEAFIAAHAPLAEDVRLRDAPFWTNGQAAFIEEKIADDADWAELVDRLDAALRKSRAA